MDKDKIIEEILEPQQKIDDSAKKNLTTNKSFIWNPKTIKVDFRGV